MSYVDLLEKEGIESHFMAVLYPKRVVSSFVLFSGSVYSKSFDYGFVQAVTSNGVALTLGSSASLSAGQFFYDNDAMTLYVRLSDSSNPSGKTIVATFEMYLGTRDFHWYRDPLDAASLAVYYEPSITKAPQTKQTASDNLFGYSPIQTSTIELSNTLHSMERMIYDSSFNKAAVKIFHVLGPIKITSIKQIYSGFCSNVKYSVGRVSIAIFNGIDRLESEWRNGTTSFFSTANFPGLDPQATGAAIQYVYGVANVIPTNVDYVNNNPGTSDNREWAVIGEDTGLSMVTKTVPASPTSTTTRTYVNNTIGLMVGDSVWLDKTSDEYAIIIGVGANYIDHDAISVAANTGSTVNRSFVSVVTIVKDNITYKALFNRDYTVNIGTIPGVSSFQFTTTMEANLSMASTLTPFDRVLAKVYGPTNLITLGGNPFGSNDAESGNLTAPIVILFDILKKLGITESEMNTASFTAAHALRAEALGFKVPLFEDTGFPLVKSVVTEILKTSLLKFYLDNDNKFSVVAIEPLGAPTKSIGDDEMLKKSFDYQFAYSDVYSDFEVKYAYSPTNERESGIASSLSVTSQSNVAKYLHGLNKTFTIKSLLFKALDAQNLSDRISFILGDREGIFTLKGKNRFFDSDLSSLIEVTRDKLPGFDFVSGTIRSRTGSPKSVVRGLDGVTLELNDQKGIEENSGSW